MVDLPYFVQVGCANDLQVHFLNFKKVQRVTRHIAVANMFYRLELLN